MVRMWVETKEVVINDYQVVCRDRRIKAAVEALRNPEGESAAWPDVDLALAEAVMTAFPGSIIAEHRVRGGPRDGDVEY